jgi:hypothetical protein
MFSHKFIILFNAISVSKIVTLFAALHHSFLAYTFIKHEFMQLQHYELADFEQAKDSSDIG